MLTTLTMTAFKNIERKGENAGNLHFLPFPQCFLLKEKRVSSPRIMSPENAFNLDSSLILSSSKEGISTEPCSVKETFNASAKSTQANLNSADFSI